eukprot:gb/GEZJ01006248.1/.p1 GENE.gb/GEZJ01006248.1/~~gb/GEZJ01006248.1/.p1  ORF type:complete len:258 (-),score=22.58 gb/GEZJ01006248.1/:172-921(-)
MYNRVHLCNYVYHLLLHLGDNIRNCWPISLLGQWTTENFIGYANKMTKAKYLFAESAREKIKYHAAASLYSMRYGFQIPHLKDQDVETPYQSSIASGDCPSEETHFSLLGPCFHCSISQLENRDIPGLRDFLERYYISKLELSRNEAHGLLEANDSITLWGRLREDKTLTMIPWIYHVSSQYEEQRQTFYFSGMFRSRSSMKVEVYNGNSFFFLSQEMNDVFYMLVVADWVYRGLKRGFQGQVYAYVCC